MHRMRCVGQAHHLRAPHTVMAKEGCAVCCIWLLQIARGHVTAVAASNAMHCIADGILIISELIVNTLQMC